MPCLGEKFICGGQEFWCGGFLPSKNQVLLHCGFAAITVPLENFDAVFQRVGALQVEGTYLAQHSYNSIVEGNEYEVTAINGDQITLSTGETISFALFAALF